MNALGVIPARLLSTRFPKKILYKIDSKPMVVHVYEKAMKAKKLDDVIVAIDSIETEEVLQNWDVKTMMTSDSHISGTDRVFEVAQNHNFNIIVNIQADEPMLEPQLIDSIIEMFEDQDCQIATAAGRNMTNQKLLDQNVVKVVLDENNFAVNFYRDIDGRSDQYYHHIGLYAFRNQVLKKFTGLPPSKREVELKLEQMRAIDNDIGIKVHLIDEAMIGIDTLDDLINL